MLREAGAMRERGEVHEDVTLACVANPSLEGAARDPTARLRAKLDAGAEMVVTQPAMLAPATSRIWWDAGAIAFASPRVRRRLRRRVPRELAFGSSLAEALRLKRRWVSGRRGWGGCGGIR